MAVAHSRPIDLVTPPQKVAISPKEVPRTEVFDSPACASPTGFPYPRPRETVFELPLSELSYPAVNEEPAGPLIGNAELMPTAFPVPSRDLIDEMDVSRVPENDKLAEADLVISFIGVFPPNPPVVFPNNPILPSDPDAIPNET